MIMQVVLYTFQGEKRRRNGQRRAHNDDSGLMSATWMRRAGHEWEIIPEYSCHALCRYAESRSQVLAVG